MKSAVAVVFAAVLVLALARPGWSIPFVNGDFETGDLTGYFTEDDSSGSNPAINVGSDPNTGNHYGLIAPSGASFLNSLGQGFSIPADPSILSFDFAFSTQGSDDTVGQFLDSFSVSVYTTSDNDYLDILVVDAYGVIPDPSAGMESVTGATPISVSYNSALTIPGFEPFLDGTTFFGRVSLLFPDSVFGEDAAIYFDVLDELDGFSSIAAIDNLSASPAAPIPEPGTVLLVGSGLAGLARLRRRAIRK